MELRSRWDREQGGPGATEFREEVAEGIAGLGIGRRGSGEQHGLGSRRDRERCGLGTSGEWGAPWLGSRRGVEQVG